jgi:histone deacetylase 11
MARIVYHPSYNIGFFGIERLHPFDSKKFGRAWKLLQQQFGKRLNQHWVRPLHPIRKQALLTVHSAAYLDQLGSSAYLAGALELGLLRWLPAKLIDYGVLRPMRWGAMGSIVAAREALSAGCAINLAGGYHHAKPNKGEGFCIYSDAALAIADLRLSGRLSETDRVAYIDLDAHQGNGVCHAFMKDRRVGIFDIFNESRYPAADWAARERIDCAIPLTDACGESEYLKLLRTKLPSFLDTIAGHTALSIYNAGTDVFERDRFGGLNLSANGIFERDRFVFDELKRRGIPTVMLLSGGYSDESYKHVARSVQYALENL